MKLKPSDIIVFLTSEGCTAANVQQKLKNIYHAEIIHVSNVQKNG